MNKTFCEDCGIKVSRRVEYDTFKKYEITIKKKIGAMEWKDGWRCEKCSRRKQTPMIKF